MKSVLFHSVAKSAVQRDKCFKPNVWFWAFSKVNIQSLIIFQVWHFANCGNILLIDVKKNCFFCDFGLHVKKKEPP